VAFDSQLTMKSIAPKTLISAYLVAPSSIHVRINLMDVAPREINVGLESKFVSIISISFHSIEMVVTNRPHTHCLNRGDCDNDDQCGPGLVCDNGLNNCQSQFGWQNGRGFYDCCIDDPNSSDTPTASTNRCGDSNCKCTPEEVAAYIEDSEEVICVTSAQSGCKIDPSFVEFTVPTDNICEDELNADNLFQDVTTKNQAQTDINAALNCLYYSALENSYTGAEYDCLDEDGVIDTCTYPLSCDSLLPLKRESCNFACNGRNDPIFKVRSLDKRGGLFQYRIPTSLPSLDERLGRDSTTGQLTGEESLGAFLPFDIALTATDEIAAEFTVEVFEEFMTCAVSGNEDGQIFFYRSSSHLL